MNTTTLTREQIAAMDAGRDMDALVAEHVMGWKRPPGPSLPGTIDEWEEHDHDKNGCCLNVMNMRTRQVATFSEWCDAFIWPGNSGRVLRYSADIAAAWQVVEHLTQYEYVKVRVEASMYHGNYCTIVAADPSQRRDGDPVKRDVIGVWGESPAHAICRACLLATLEDHVHAKPIDHRSRLPAETG